MKKWFNRNKKRSRSAHGPAAIQTAPAPFQNRQKKADPKSP